MNTNSCCVSTKICACCGVAFSELRPQSRINPHNCEPCVSWAQVECAPRQGLTVNRNTTTKKDTTP